MSINSSKRRQNILEIMFCQKELLTKNLDSFFFFFDNKL